MKTWVKRSGVSGVADVIATFVTLEEFFENIASYLAWGMSDDLPWS